MNWRGETYAKLVRVQCREIVYFNWQHGVLLWQLHPTDHEYYYNENKHKEKTFQSENVICRYYITERTNCEVKIRVSVHAFSVQLEKLTIGCSIVPQRRPHLVSQHLIRVLHSKQMNICIWREDDSEKRVAGKSNLRDLRTIGKLCKGHGQWCSVWTFCMRFSLLSNAKKRQTLYQ